MPDYTLFVPGVPGGELDDLAWTLKESEAKTVVCVPASQGATLGYNIHFTDVLTGPEQSAVTSITDTPANWFPKGSYLVAGLPTPALAGKDVLWVRDAAREGGGTGTHAFHDGTNWRRMSDNVIVSV